MAKDKRVLTRDALGSAGITYHEEPINPEALLKECPQANVLTRFLLDFKHIIAPERWVSSRMYINSPYVLNRTWKELDRETREQVSEEEREHVVIPEKRPHAQAHIQTLQNYESQYNIPRCEANFGLALDIQKEARRIRSKDEDRWRDVAKCAFKRLKDVALKAECDDFPRTAADIISRYRVETDHTWEFGRGVLRAYSQTTRSKLKAPKPDLFLSFHAYMQGEAECGPLNGDDYIENFGITRLNWLYEKYIIMADKCRDLPFGFNPSPCKEFFSAESVKDRTCFPWAVCEWKHHGKINTSFEEYLHCQAANAAAVCLTLFANAAAGGRPTPVLSEIRPVVCMTFTGPRIKVWIAYVTAIEKARYRYRMRCIWKGNLYNGLDNIKLCVIIENLHFWAMNHLRPWLSGCIDQWKRVIDEFEAENNRSKPERLSENQYVKANQSKARIPMFDANQSKPRSQLGSGGRIVQKGRSKQLDSYGRSNFALRRANTLESCLDQDEDHTDSDNTSESSEKYDEEEEEEESEEDHDDDDDDEYEPGSEEEEDEEREENIDIALEQLKISLRNDKRGREALNVLQRYLWEHEE